MQGYPHTSPGRLISPEASTGDLFPQLTNPPIRDEIAMVHSVEKVEKLFITEISQCRIGAKQRQMMRASILVGFFPIRALVRHCDLK
jgi:hypothetical protein